MLPSSHLLPLAGSPVEPEMLFLANPSTEQQGFIILLSALQFRQWELGVALAAVADDAR